MMIAKTTAQLVSRSFVSIEEWCDFWSLRHIKEAIRGITAIKDKWIENDRKWIKLSAS
jgi:hypothetical protein